MPILLSTVSTTDRTNEQTADERVLMLVTDKPLFRRVCVDDSRHSDSEIVTLQQPLPQAQPVAVTLSKAVMNHDNFCV